MGYIREVLSDRNKTIYQMAKDSGISNAVLYRLDNGTRTVSLNTARRIVEYFQSIGVNITVDGLIKGMNREKVRNCDKRSY